VSSEFAFDAGGYRCVGVRSDHAWGHGLKVNIFCEEGRLLNVIGFACHPEFPDYESLQAMDTEQLVALAAHHLNTGQLEDSLVEVREVGLKLLVNFRVASK
jgi:hypothetical protein